jgi:serine/threonine-protein kinase
VPDSFLATAASAAPLSSRAPRRKNADAQAGEEKAKILPRRLGRYNLFAHIGRGGMADIYLAQADTGLGVTRLVVIKEMLAKLAHSAEFAEMLVSEAKLAAKLSHANVVKVEDLGRADGTLFIAMEYVEGIDLRELLRRCAKSKIALPVEFSLRIVIEALRGLSFAHRARDDEGRHLGIVHRDVSPSNVLLSFEGEVKLCDFGIARANAVAEDLPEEAILGKAGYMSPEQARGEPLDARADVFAVGIILWEMLAGRRLYKATEGQRLLDAARAVVIPPLVSRDLPREEELHRIVTRALSADREARYPSAAAMLADLEDYAAAARMVASPIRFGEWLMESFGQEVVGDRRARERVMRALSRGPVARIEPIRSEEASPPPSSAVRPVLPESFLPEYELTPSMFPVALRADPEASVEPTPSAKAIVAAPIANDAPAAEEAPLASPWVNAPIAAPAPRRLHPRLVVLALVLLAIAGVAARLAFLR